LQPDLKKRFQSASVFLTALNSLEDVSSQAPNPLTSAGSKEAAVSKAQKAMQMGAQYAELSTAIQLLEEALRESPSLSQQYGEVLAKWKSGVVL
jgi:hypothetical protein